MCIAKKQKKACNNVRNNNSELCDNYDNKACNGVENIKNTELRSDLIAVLRITGAFGIKGYIRARLFSDNLKSYKKLYNKEGKSFDFSIVRFTGGNSILLSLEGISDRTQALALKGKEFFIAKEHLKNTEKDEYYICDLIGKRIKIIGNDEIDCIITNVFNFGAGDLIEISYKDATFMIPFTKENFWDSLDSSNNNKANTSAEKNKNNFSSDILEKNSKDEIFMSIDVFNRYKDLNS